MKSEIIKKLEELLENSNFSAISNQVKNLQRDYENVFSKELEKAKQEFIDDGGKMRDFVFSKSPEDIKIVELFDRFRKLKKQEDEQIAKEQQKCLETKNQIISDINDLSRLETNIGSALKKLNELQAKWKETGNVSPHKYKELQSEYSKAVESFYYNLNIYRALQDHDLKRNFDLKNEILSKVKSLLENDNIRETEQLIKTYRNDWEEIGPVSQDKWESLKSEYRSVLDQIYTKIKAHYKALEDQLEKNLQAKKSLLEKARFFIEQLPQNEESWKQKTDELIALQAEYKSSGKTEQKHGDEVWKNFREVCDTFFAKKKEFFTELKEKYAEIKVKKQELITKAEELSSSQEWKDTSEKIIRLQDKWKQLPTVGMDEFRLFTKFRKACNTFFEAKRTFFESQEAGYEANLKVKEEILQRILSFQLSGEHQADRETLKKFSDEWAAAGHVPFKEKQRVNDAFYNKLDELYESLNINKNEKAFMQFKNKIERLSGSENSGSLLKKEFDFLRRQIDEITGNIRTYENNLGFFKNGKGKNTFQLEAESKIEQEKAKIAELKEKQKYVSEIMNTH